MSNFKLNDDYVDVAERIVEFREKYPAGSLQPADLSKPFEVITIGSQDFVVVVAAAYRTADDQRPGIGMAYETFPGRTPYTKNSELQNAETSAWGRAIVAALAADTKRGIASAQEMRGRGSGSEPALEPHVAARIELSSVIKTLGIAPKDAAARFASDHDEDLGESTNVEAIKALTRFYAEQGVKA